MEKSIVNGGNGEKRPLSLEREKLALKGWKSKTIQTQILVNEWYCIHNIKFRFVNVKIKIKSNQELKFDTTYNIKVKTITINKDEYMTHWNENKSY